MPEDLRVENPIVCSNINKIGFRMCGGVPAYQKVLRERQFRAIAMSAYASGAIPGARSDRMGRRATQDRVDRIRSRFAGEHPQHRSAGCGVLAADEPHTLTTSTVAILTGTFPSMMFAGK